MLNLGRSRQRPSAEGALGADDRTLRAIELFNAGDRADTVRRLTRMLGAPDVSIGTAAGPRREVRITVAWELSWYQWAVDPDNQHFPFRDLGQGGDPAELDLSARTWNARGLADGRIALGLADDSDAVAYDQAA
ncbi:MAG: hypothetical protein QOJ38_530 [Solirubrobacterales bacterium]|nr:hypothetical protein [Solirubrobacterales bacterium]